MAFGTTRFATSYVDTSLTAEAENSSERDEASMSALPASQSRKF